MTHRNRNWLAYAVVGSVVAVGCASCMSARQPAAIWPDSRNASVLQSGQMTLIVQADEALDALTVIEAPSDAAAQPAWTTLRATDAFRRLHDREASMGRAFTDADFYQFLRSGAARGQATALRRRLAAWRAADLGAAVRNAAAYLPPSAPVRASLYFVIKPFQNTFVYDTDNNPAIFVAVDTALSGAAFANEVSHELHHVGYAAACKDKTDTTVAEPARTVVHWMGAFGEGWAMLAAAGGPTIHPHATSDSGARARWDRDYANVSTGVRDLETFFVSVLDRRLVAKDSIQGKAMSFFGVQGPWYTIGYLMARTIELTYGRPRLMSVLCDPLALMAEYQRAAGDANRRGASLPLWSHDLLVRLGAQ